MTTTFRAATANRSIRTLTGLLLAVALILAAPMSVGAQSTTDIADEIERNGYYAEPAVDGDLSAAIERANRAGTAFVWLDQIGGADLAAEVAAAVWDELDARNSQYGLVLVLVRDGYFVQAPNGFDPATLEAADVAALDGFSSRNEALGLDSFTEALTAGSAAGSAGSSGSDSGTTATTTPTSSGGDSGGFSLTSLLLPFLLIVGGFFLIRNWSGRRKADAAMKAEIEADRAEIKEQLRDNADRVIDLGDRVVLSENSELISDYEQASRTYQDVSHAIDSATTAEEVDALDDQIDHAEWQFEKIEATLEGRSVPPSPADVEAGEAEEQARQAAEETARRKAENEKPALGRDESVISGPRSDQRRTSYPRRSAPRSPFPGGMGRRRGGFGGGLGSILGSIILGQMNRPRSRRSQRRSGSIGGGLGGGSLGGGVLRRGGSSSGSRSRGSGRSFGGSGRSRGSGRSF